MDAHALLDAWDAGQTLCPERWAVGLLAAADGRSSIDVHARRSIGDRDAALLRLRDALFGTRLVTNDRCPGCGTSVETELESSQLLCPPSVPLPADATFEQDGYTLAHRLPDTNDLIAISSYADVRDAEAALAARCIRATRTTTAEPVALDAVPAHVMARVLQRMGDADPQANVELALRCPECGLDRTLAFDIVSYLWQELDAWARRLLREVHDLATAYGWREADIVAMSPARRRYYLAFHDR